MKTIRLDHDIVIELGDKDPERVGPRGACPGHCYLGGTISSSLHETCHCGSQTCHHEDSPREFNIAVDAVESFLLAMAVAGVDVESPAVTEALETVLDKMSERYDT